MPYVPITAATTAASAARLQQMQTEKEEEEMTQYTKDDLNSDWEFKIVRSHSGAFRKREVLDKLVEEERRAGWVMLEKLDDHRIRFKRSNRARAQDAYLPPEVDPYRSYYGASPNRQTAVALGLVVAGLLLMMTLGLGVFVSRQDVPAVSYAAGAPVILILIIVLGVGLLAVAMARRR
jgi:hypothetical protein